MQIGSSRYASSHRGSCNRGPAASVSSRCRQGPLVAASTRRRRPNLIGRAAISGDRDEEASESSHTDPEEAGGGGNVTTSRLSLEEEDAEFMATSFSVSQEMRDRNAKLCDDLRGELILAPLTRGNHLPFRKWCMEMGCKVTMSEMALAKQLIKGDRVERARLYRADDEALYGFQIATKIISEGVEASKLARESGARWLDLNCGCPIYEASRRGVGAVLLKKPRSLAKLVHGIAKDSELPLTVKIRLGESEKKVNVDRVVKLLSAAGAAAIIVHGRTMEQRYRKPANWQAVEAVSHAPGSVPIIGNGDILTYFEAERRLRPMRAPMLLSGGGGEAPPEPPPSMGGPGCLAVMVGRGALIKPWIFKEVREGRELNPSTLERVAMYRRLYCLMKSHFGDDDMGRRKAFYFAPWHHNFFFRYRHQPREVYESRSLAHPLIMTRTDTYDPLIGEASHEVVPPLERLLRCGAEAAHEAIAGLLWEACSDDEAVGALTKLAESESLEMWEREFKGKDGERGDEREGRG